MNYKKLWISLLCCMLLLAGCSGTPAVGENGTPSPSGSLGTDNSGDGNSGTPSSGGSENGNGSENSDGSENSGGGSTAVSGDVTVLDPSEIFTNRDYETAYTEKGSVLIQLNGDSASCSLGNVEISGTTVTIKGSGTYLISGTLNNGIIIVDAKETDKPQLVLNGVSITSPESAALYILNADKVFVTLADGTDNYLANGGSFTAIDENNIDGAVFSKQDLTFNGSGTLTVTSPSGHGIVCKDDLVFTSGTYSVASASHGLDVNDSVRITDAEITIDAGKDGIHVENSDDTASGFFHMVSGTLDISAEGDGISAVAYAQITDGTIQIVSGGGSENGESQTSDFYGGFMGGMGGPGGPGGYGGSSSTTSDSDSTSLKGIKTTGSLLISGGSFSIDSADDALHSNASIDISGGSFSLASGDDGIHADETLTIRDGSINISESYEGLEALDIAVSGGNITLAASDDGLNAAGGVDQSGFGGTRGNDRFGGGGGRGGMGGMGGMGSASNGSIVISGGTLNITASGDGIDANGSLTISGGFTTVCGPTRGDTATLDYDTSATIIGGTFIGTGAAGMAQTFSASEQGVISVSVGSQSAGTKITLTDENGSVVISYEPALSFGVVILSSPDIIQGESYTITVGSASGTFEAN